MVSRCACEKPVLPLLACFADGAPNGVEQATRRRDGVRALLREAGRRSARRVRKDFPVRVRELAAGDAVLTGLVEVTVVGYQGHDG